MPKPEEQANTVLTHKASKLWVFQGVTILSLVGGAWYLSGRLTTIEGKLDHQGDEIKLLTEQTKSISDAVLNPQGIAPRLARVEQKLDDLSAKIDRLSPKIVRKDFEDELNRLNARINSLQDEEQRAAAKSTEAEAAYRRQLDEFARLRSRLNEADSEFSQIASDVASLSSNANSNEWRLPEGYRADLIERLNRLQQRLLELRSRLKG